MLYIDKKQKRGFVMTNENLKKLILTALFAALACITTMIMKIPTPGTGGYIHVGHAIVILSGVVLGPWYGFAAAGLGSCMADLIDGYFIYVSKELAQDYQRTDCTGNRTCLPCDR